ncbi:proteasome assembly chaperone 1-like isoform X2 [Zootermopsis nevadensis]|uniref:proteasome assembly chaperone 1-like isoform X2 n=1 Tax=Zootermopsis nevadensis TaxID=136037 RepID=UPI000B8E2809|nr:proteasome assembly chaperone 1-like isoform X2 [Zootermopsis nevadensis]
MSLIAKMMYIQNLIKITGFIEACFVDKGVPIVEIKETGTEDNEQLRRRKIKSSVIYHLASDILLCICSPHLDIAQSFDFTEKISPWMKNAEQVIILTCSHISGYHITRYQNDPPDIFMKALRTNNFIYPVLSDRLEQPNTVKGIPAAVLTWCQTFKIPAVLYICYARNYEVDSDSVKLFVHLFSKLPFKLLKEKPNFTNKLCGGSEISSTLYL